MSASQNGVNGSLSLALDSKLKDLSLLKSPGKTRKKVIYLGDDEDHSQREPARSAISPSPRQDERHRAEAKQEAVKDIAESYTQILHGIGEDPSRQGLLRTPERAAKAMLYFTKGYDEKISGKQIFYTINWWAHDNPESLINELSGFD